uniref:Uncharacterized protein n=1 Tax=Glossina austeni TaxID=7395 RepID=A0A1A9V0M3_GLOAU
MLQYFIVISDIDSRSCLKVLDTQAHASAATLSLKGAGDNQQASEDHDDAFEKITSLDNENEKVPDKSDADLGSEDAELRMNPDIHKKDSACDKTDPSLCVVTNQENQSANTVNLTKPAKQQRLSRYLVAFHRRNQQINVLPAKDDNNEIVGVNAAEEGRALRRRQRTRSRNGKNKTTRLSDNNKTITSGKRAAPKKPSNVKSSVKSSNVKKSKSKKNAKSHRKISRSAKNKQPNKARDYKMKSSNKTDNKNELKRTSPGKRNLKNNNQTGRGSTQERKNDKHYAPIRTTDGHDDTNHGSVRAYGRAPATNPVRRNFNLLDILSQKGLAGQSSPTIEVIQSGGGCDGCDDYYDEYDYDYCQDGSCYGECFDCDDDDDDDDDYDDEDDEDDDYFVNNEADQSGSTPPASSELHFRNERKEKNSKKTHNQDIEDANDDDNDDDDDDDDDSDDSGDDGHNEDDEEQVTDDNEAKDSDSENKSTQVQSSTSQVNPRQQIRDEVQAVLNAVRRSDMLRREQAHRKLVRSNSKCKAEVKRLRRKLKYKSYTQRRRVAAAKRRAQRLRRRRQQKQKRRRNKTRTVKVKA